MLQRALGWFILLSPLSLHAVEYDFEQIRQALIPTQEQICAHMFVSDFPPNWGVTDDDIYAFAETDSIALIHAEVLKRFINLAETGSPLFFGVMGAYMAVPVPADTDEEILEHYENIPWTQVKRFFGYQIDEPFYRKRGIQLKALAGFFKSHEEMVQTDFNIISGPINMRLIFNDLISAIGRDQTPRRVDRPQDRQAIILRLLANRSKNGLEPRTFFAQVTNASAVATQTLCQVFHLPPNLTGFLERALNQIARGEAPEMKHPALKEPVAVFKKLLRRNLNSYDLNLFAAILSDYERSLLPIMKQRIQSSPTDDEDAPSFAARTAAPNDLNWRLALLSLMIELYGGETSYSDHQLRHLIKMKLKEKVKEFILLYRPRKTDESLPKPSSFFKLAEGLNSSRSEAGVNYRIAPREKPVKPQASELPDTAKVKLLSDTPISEIEFDVPYGVVFDKLSQTQQVSFIEPVVSHFNNPVIEAIPLAPLWIEAILAGPARSTSQKGIKKVEPPFEDKYDYEVKLMGTGWRLLGYRNKDGVIIFEKFDDPH